MSYNLRSNKISSKLFLYYLQNQNYNFINKANVRPNIGDLF